MSLYIPSLLTANRFREISVTHAIVFVIPLGEAFKGWIFMSTQISAGCQCYIVCEGDSNSFTVLRLSFFMAITIGVPKNENNVRTQ